jgi:hypothetical protein
MLVGFGNMFSPTETGDVMGMSGDRCDEVFLRDRPSRRISRQRSVRSSKKNMEVSLSHSWSIDSPLLFQYELTQLKRSFVGTGWCSFARKGMLGSEPRSHCYLDNNKVKLQPSNVGGCVYIYM